MHELVQNLILRNSVTLEMHMSQISIQCRKFDAVLNLSHNCVNMAIQMTKQEIGERENRAFSFPRVRVPTL